MSAVLKTKSESIGDPQPSIRIKRQRKRLPSEIAHASSFEAKLNLAAFGHNNPLVVASHGFLHLDDEYFPSAKGHPADLVEIGAKKIMAACGNEFFRALQRRDSRSLRELADYLDNPGNPFCEDQSRTMILLLIDEMGKAGGQDKFQMTIGAWREVLLSHGVIKSEMDDSQLRRVLKGCGATIASSKC